MRFRPVLLAAPAALTLCLGLGPATALPSAQAAPSPSTDSQPTVSVLYFQDGHEIAPVTQDGGDHGGIARLATVLGQERAKGVPTSTVFGGDLGGGTLFGAVCRGEAMVEALNQVKVDVAGFGQHDFDYGLSQALANAHAPSFPWVSSNLRSAEGPLLGENSTVLAQELGGVRLGYLGLTAGMETT